MCIYIYIYICIHLSMLFYLCIYIYMYYALLFCGYIHNMYMYACMHVCMHVCWHFMYMYIFMYIYICLQMHTDIGVYVYKQMMHVYICSLFSCSNLASRNIFSACLSEGRYSRHLGKANRTNADELLGELYRRVPVYALNCFTKTAVPINPTSKFVPATLMVAYHRLGCHATNGLEVREGCLHYSNS